MIDRTLVELALGAQVVPDGTRFRVWAPRPSRVDLVVLGGEGGERRIATRDLGGGLREAFAEGVGAGARYLWLLDGERRRPDPCSRAQPEGVHGPSQVIDPRAFAWSEADARFRAPPLAEQILYELHVGTFSPEGDFAGVAKRLDRILESGATTVEIMPVGAFPGARNWGYDGVAWMAPAAAYGGPEGLRALVDACHARGLAVVLDVVLNHLGPEGNYLAELAPYFASRHQTPWGDALDLDGPNAPSVRRHLIHVARSLALEYHLDGLRLDAVHALVDDSPLHLVAELTATLHADAVARGKPIYVIAESDLGEARVVEAAEAGGWGCDAMWADDFHHAVHALVTGERDTYYADFGEPWQLARTVERGQLYTGRRSRFRQRRFGTPAAHLDGRRLCACVQNHDQIGNRAQGERVAALRPEASWATACALLTSPFLPLLYAGEEYGETAPFLFFTSFDDAQTARAVREGRRREYGEGAPDPQDPETMARCVLDPERQGARGEALRRWYRALAELRRARPSLASGELARTEAIAEGAAQLIRRVGPHEETLAIYNLSGAAQTAELPRPRRGRWSLLLDGGAFAGPAGARVDEERVTLPPWGALVLGAP